jgi:hypothetical protein
MAGGKPARELPLKRESTEIFVHALGSAGAIGGHGDLRSANFCGGLSGARRVVPPSERLMLCERHRFSRASRELVFYKE